MRRTSRLTLIVVFAVGAWVTLHSNVLAKGQTDKAIIEGPGISKPIVVTDEQSLAPFNIWLRGYIDWRMGLADQPPDVETIYKITLYSDTAGFGLDYAPDPGGGRGYVFLPTRPRFGTMYTNTSDPWNPNGKWQYATAAWDAVIQGALADVLVKPTPETSESGVTSSGAGWLAALIAIGVLAGAPSLLWFRRRSKPVGQAQVERN